MTRGALVLAGRARLVRAGGLAALLLAETWWQPGGRAFTLVTGVVVAALAVLGDQRSPAAARVTAGCAVAAVLSDLTSAPSQPGLAATAALYLAGADAARTQRPRRVIALAMVGSVVLVIGRLQLRAAWAWALAFLGLLGWVLALGIGGWLRVADGRRRVAVAAARREERIELARELHDVVAHHVAAIVVQAQATRLLCVDGEPLPPGQLAAIETAGVEALDAMRRVIGLLREDDAVPRSTPERVADLVRRFAELGPPVDVSGELDPALPPPMASTVYRVVQEGLTNIRLHAPDARRVQVGVRSDTSAVTVTVSDDGPPQPPSPPGHGLVGMCERVEAFGGSFQAGPLPMGGWSLTAVIPLAGAAR